MSRYVIKQIEQNVNWLWNLGGDIWVFIFGFLACWKIMVMERVRTKVGLAVWKTCLQVSGGDIVAPRGCYGYQRLTD
jgi:hypothetical protein